MQHNFTVDAKIISVHGSHLTQKSLMKTQSLPTQKSSTQHNFTADVEIVNVHGSQLTQKSLIKIKLLPIQRSSTQHNFTVDARIVSTHNHTFIHMVHKHAISPIMQIEFGY